ncbi:MAG: hypothetical protein ACRDYB_11615, partial [Acidimicrobiales bacterium]
ITLDKTGTYRGQCTQFCGIYHSLMRFRLEGDTPSQFAAWVRTHHSTSSNSLPGATGGSAT